MSNIKKVLDSLQPYLIGIRYIKGEPVLDILLTEGWTIPEDNSIKKIKGDVPENHEQLNYYMIFSEDSTIGLDELLDFLHKIIKINVEREKKHELLKRKFNELKEVFKKNPLTKLERLKFIFDDEEITKLSDLDDDMDLTINPKEFNEPIESQPQYNLMEIDQPIIEAKTDININENKTLVVSEQGELTEEELEILEEEKRGEMNRKIIEARKTNKTKIELPPRKKSIVHENYDSSFDPEEL